MSKISLSKLNGFLKIQCDDLRAAGLDASEFKDYIIAMLFLKRVNDLFDVAKVTREKNLKSQHPNITQAQLDRELEVEMQLNMNSLCQLMQGGKIFRCLQRILEMD